MMPIGFILGLATVAAFSRGYDLGGFALIVIAFAPELYRWAIADWRLLLDEPGFCDLRRLYLGALRYARRVERSQGVSELRFARKLAQVRRENRRLWKRR